MRDGIKDIKLKFECPANWDEMAVVDGDRFCNQCHKIVYDFTDARVEEFLSILTENNGHICGKFRREQIAPVYPAIPGWKKWASAAMVLIGIHIFNSKVQAQNKAPINEKHQPVQAQEELGMVGAVEIEPTFKGDFKKFMQANLHFTNGMKTGKVFAQFIVNTDGSVDDVKIIRGLGTLNDDEVIRVVKLTRWKPAMQGGKPVKCEFTVPVNFENAAKN